MQRNYFCNNSQSDALLRSAIKRLSPIPPMFELSSPLNWPTIGDLMGELSKQLHRYVNLAGESLPFDQVCRFKPSRFLELVQENGRFPHLVPSVQWLAATGVDPYELESRVYWTRLGYFHRSMAEGGCIRPCLNAAPAFAGWLKPALVQLMPDIAHHPAVIAAFAKEFSDEERAPYHLYQGIHRMARAGC